jgi:type VI secretion system secreted protein VgrG
MIFGGLAALGTRMDFAPLLDQHGRMLQVATALPSLALIAERLVMKEAVSRPFDLTLDCLSTNAHFELERLVGEQISVRLLQPDGSYRPWHGYVTGAAQLGTDGGLARFRLRMRPWLALLGERRDSFVFQDKTALAIVEDVFKDYPQANWRVETPHSLRVRSLCTQYRESDLDFVARLLAEEGLGYHFDHLDGHEADEADAQGHARHVLVISDAATPRLHLGPARFTTRHITAKLAGQKDAVTAFLAARRIRTNAVTLASWDYERVTGTAGQDASALELGELPTLEVYDGSGAYRYENAAHAQRAAALALGALELDVKRFEGQGSTRHFEAGRSFDLIDHPLYGADTLALHCAGEATASPARPDNAFTLLAVEHHASNNLGSRVARLLGLSELELGSYVNHFHCAPAAAPAVPGHVRKPTATGLQTALVVGVQGEPVTTDREHRVKVQFSWQRGVQPNAGGVEHPARSGAALAAQQTAPGEAGNAVHGSAANGNAPGDDRCGTWVRVALPAAGADWGAVFVPRVGTEVAIDFIEDDIDRPVIVGQLHNAADLPPFGAGVDSGVNHPGVLCGLHNRHLDAGGFNQWVLDDASGQLRMRLLCSTAEAELGLGHLIQQSGHGAQRGGWRGSGFEAATGGWASLRAARGLLVSATAREGRYGSARSTQMDATEALSQLRAAHDLGKRLSETARSATAHPLGSHHAGQTVEKLLARIDPAQDGRHEPLVNGQEARKAEGRTLTEPVEAFAQPLIVLDTPSSAVVATQAGIAAFSGQDCSLTCQGDAHQTAAHTWAGVSGKTTSWYVHEGGIKAFAANGPVSLRAHTDALQLLADKDITVISVNGEVRIQAKTKIELVGGQSAITLDGADIEFRTPGRFAVKGSGHAFLGGGSGAAQMPFLPQGVQTLPTWIEIDHRDAESLPMAGQAYRIFFEGGAVIAGKLDAKGHARHDNVPERAERVEYEPRTPEKDKPWDPLAELVAAASSKLS